MHVFDESVALLYDACTLCGIPDAQRACVCVYTGKWVSKGLCCVALRCARLQSVCHFAGMPHILCTSPARK